MLGDERQCKCEFDGEIAVARAVDAVGNEAFEAQFVGDGLPVNGDRRAGQR